MSVENLKADLAGIRMVDAPEDWALAAYRLAVASSEQAHRPKDLGQALELLDKAARILTADRAPLEHGRILTAAANCHRACGRAAKALELFTQAAELLTPRATPNEQAGSLVNLGLAQCEAGQPQASINTLDQAVGLITQTLDNTGNDGPTKPVAILAADDDETSRLLGAALINRAQAHQAVGGDSDLEAAVGDYRQALCALPVASLQAGMAAHGLGAAVLELCRRGSVSANANDAVSVFEQCQGVLSHASFPFHHAVSRHSLALAYEIRGEPGDLARAINSAQATLAILDPRLHTSHWQTAHVTLTRLQATWKDGAGAELDSELDVEACGLGPVAGLLAATCESEREQLLRDRLLRAAALPREAMSLQADELIGALVRLDINDYQRVLHTLVGVLMELPDPLLEAACATICRTHQSHESTAALDRALDTTVTQRLFGPQRVRLRDLLEANGWVRP